MAPERILELEGSLGWVFDAVERTQGTDDHLARGKR